MRTVRDITQEENFRVEAIGRFDVVRRDPVKPEVEGTLVLVPFRITGYDRDCDGSLMARLEGVDCNGEPTGLKLDCCGLDPTSDLVVSPEELKALFEPPTESESAVK